jgi:hypothetical protein
MKLPPHVIFDYAPPTNDGAVWYLCLDPEECSFFIMCMHKDELGNPYLIRSEDKSRVQHLVTMALMDKVKPV